MWLWAGEAQSWFASKVHPRPSLGVRAPETLPSHFSVGTHAPDAGWVDSDLVGLQWGPAILPF